MAFLVKTITTDPEILAAYRVVKQLRPQLTKLHYLEMVKIQRSKVGFKMAALYERKRVIAVSGYRFCYSLAWGKFLYIDDLVTDNRHRSKGAGAQLLNWLVDLAKAQQCDEVRLDSALHRHDAHRFYLRERMDIACFNFRLDLRETNKASQH